MDERSSKEKILAKVRKALLQKGEPYYNPGLDLDSDIYVPEEGELVEVFSGNFIANKGHFIYCFNEYHFIEEFLAVTEKNGWQNVACLEKPLQELLAKCDFPVLSKPAGVKQADVGLSGCEALVSRTGSVIVSSKGNNSRTISVFPPAHIVVAWRNQLVYDLKQYLAMLNLGDLTALPSMISIISGPSRTADIEKTLVLGAHGPKQIFVFFIDEDRAF